MWSGLSLCWLAVSSAFISCKEPSLPSFDWKSKFVMYVLRIVCIFGADEFPLYHLTKLDCARV